VIYKLLGFTLAMVAGPIGTYYLTVDNVFRGTGECFCRRGRGLTDGGYIGNATFAGATAAIMANVVLIAYVVVAMKEDQSESIAAAEKEKKK
jgi:hypothetical protein